MSNPLFDRFGPGQPQPTNFRLPGPFGKIGDIAGQYQQFKNNLQGQNAEQIVRNMIASGQMSQEQLNQLSAYAQQIAPLLGQR